MKLSLAVGAVSLVFGVYTQASPMEIYNALNIPEKDGREVSIEGMPALGADILVKTVGGVSCEKVTVVSPGAEATYSCELARPLDSEKIYNALAIEEKDGRPVDASGNPSVGSDILVKKVSSLICTKTVLVYPGATPAFTCEILKFSKKQTN